MDFIEEGQAMFCLIGIRESISIGLLRITLIAYNTIGYSLLIANELASILVPITCLRSVSISKL